MTRTFTARARYREEETSKTQGSTQGREALQRHQVITQGKAVAGSVQCGQRDTAPAAGIWRMGEDERVVIEQVETAIAAPSHVLNAPQIRHADI